MLPLTPVEKVKKLALYTEIKKELGKQKVKERRKV
jgi:hypothetical protein